jgi:hypothetical protein
LIETFTWLASFLQVETIEHDKSSTQQLDHGVQGMFAPTVWRPQARTVPGIGTHTRACFLTHVGIVVIGKAFEKFNCRSKKAALNRFPPNCGKESKER